MKFNMVLSHIFDDFHFLEFLQKLFPIASTLYSIYGPSYEDNLQLCSSTPVHPWAVLMAFVIVAAKLGYRIDGKEPVLSGIEQDVEWLEWARSHFSTMQILSAYPLKSAEVNITLRFAFTTLRTV
jgi:hypothetical protein